MGRTPVGKGMLRRWLVGLAVVILSNLAVEADAGRSSAAGYLRITHRDSPASMSIHEEGTISVVLPMMGVFNNLVLFDPHVRQNSLDDRARPRHKLDMERGRQDADIHAAQGRDLA